MLPDYLAMFRFAKELHIALRYGTVLLQRPSSLLFLVSFPLF